MWKQFLITSAHWLHFSPPWMNYWISTKK
jgi:hypothetical protein